MLQVIEVISGPSASTPPQVDGAPHRGLCEAQTGWKQHRAREEQGL